MRNVWYLAMCISLLVRVPIFLHGAQPSEAEMARYLVALSQQVVQVAQKLLELDEVLIFKVKRKFPIDRLLVSSKVTSANRQAELLIQRIADMHNTLPFGYSGRLEVTANQRTFQDLMAQHVRNIAQLAKLDVDLGDRLAITRIRKSDGNVITSIGVPNAAPDMNQESSGGKTATVLGTPVPPTAANKGTKGIPGVASRDENTSGITDFNAESSKAKAEFSEDIKDGF